MTKNSCGYLMEYDPTHILAQASGYVLIHRKRWYQYRGSIPKGSIIHHKDGDKTNNRMANLEILSPSDHASEHFQRGDLRHNPQGFRAMIERNQKLGVWNKGTTEIVKTQCKHCRAEITKPKWKVEFNQRRGMNIFCNRSCRSKWIRAETVRKFWDARAKGVKV